MAVPGQERKPASRSSSGLLSVPCLVHPTLPRTQIRGRSCRDTPHWGTSFPSNQPVLADRKHRSPEQMGAGSAHAPWDTQSPPKSSVDFLGGWGTRGQGEPLGVNTALGACVALRASMRGGPCPLDVDFCFPLPWRSSPHPCTHTHTDTQACTHTHTLTHMHI